jgi:hypothetical protein
MARRETRKKRDPKGKQRKREGKKTSENILA